MVWGTFRHSGEAVASVLKVERGVSGKGGEVRVETNRTEESSGFMMIHVERSRDDEDEKGGRLNSQI